MKVDVTRQMTRHRIKFTKGDLEFSQISYQMSPEVFLYFFYFFTIKINIRIKTVRLFSMKNPMSAFILLNNFAGLPSRDEVHVSSPQTWTL